MQASPTHGERAISLVLRFYRYPVFQPLVVEKSLYLSRAAPNFAAESAEPKSKNQGRVSLRRKTQCVRNPTHHPMGVLLIGHLGLRRIQVKLDVKLKAAINRKLTKKPLRQTSILERTKKDIFFFFVSANTHQVTDHFARQSVTMSC